MTPLDCTDRQIIRTTQAGLPLVGHPYAEIATQLGLEEAEVIARLAKLMKRGVIRRIAAAPNHYRLGMTANGMTVWDISDDVVSQVGREIGALPFVTHCYQRPRCLPEWPFNLFAMLHGSTRQEVETKQRELKLLLGPACRACDILYSKRILKKTGLRLSQTGG